MHPKTFICLITQTLLQQGLFVPYTHTHINEHFALVVKTDLWSGVFSWSQMCNLNISGKAWTNLLELLLKTQKEP